MDFFAATNQMGVLIIIMAVGFVLKKTGTADDETKRHLSVLVTTPLQAGLILSTMMSVDTELNAERLVEVLGVALASYAVMCVLAVFVPVLLCVSSKDRSLYMFMTAFGNVAFIGYPVVSVVLGAQGVFYATLINICFFLLMFTLGISVISGGTERIQFKKFINTPMICMAVSIVFLLLDIKLPAVITDACAALAGALVPVSMLAIGVSLGGMELKSVFCGWRAYAVSAVKLLGCPFAVWFVLRTFVSDTVMLNTAVILAAMPVATITTMFAIQYGRDERAATSSVFVSTILSAATIPLLALVIG